MGRHCTPAMRLRPSYRRTCLASTAVVLARDALHASGVYALGQLEAGITVWRLDRHSKWQDSSCFILPGEGSYDLRGIVEKLSGTSHTPI